jgi:hypothetical protein
VGLVIVGAIVIMDPFLTLFVLNAISLLAPIFNPITCISIANNIAKVSFVLISVTLLRESDATGRLPA